MHKYLDAEMLSVPVQEEEEEEEEANMVQLRVILLGLLAAVWCFTGAAEGELVTACLNDVVKMTCAGGKKIRIFHIGFVVGRKCSGGRTVPSGYERPCVKPSYQAAIKDHCNNERSCEFAITQAVVNMFSCKNKKITLQTAIFLNLQLMYTCI